MHQHSQSSLVCTYWFCVSFFLYICIQITLIPDVQINWGWGYPICVTPCIVINEQCIADTNMVDDIIEHEFNYGFVSTWLLFCSIYWDLMYKTNFDYMYASIFNLFNFISCFIQYQ